MIRTLLLKLFGRPRYKREPTVEEAVRRARELRRKLAIARGALYSVKFDDPDFTQEGVIDALVESEDLYQPDWERE